MKKQCKHIQMFNLFDIYAFAHFSYLLCFCFVCFVVKDKQKIMISTEFTVWQVFFSYLFIHCAAAVAIAVAFLLLLLNYCLH